MCENMAHHPTSFTCLIIGSLLCIHAGAFYSKKGQILDGSYFLQESKLIFKTKRPFLSKKGGQFNLKNKEINIYSHHFFVGINKPFSKGGELFLCTKNYVLT